MRSLPILGREARPLHIVRALLQVGRVDTLLPDFPVNLQTIVEPCP